MEQMKTDMGGGAAVIGAMSALARLGVDKEVIGLVPATENLPGYDAIKPGDVLRHYGGKTTEVLNTDAEGRLILADSLAYASELEPDAMVDLATLTGAIMSALGSKRSGLFANDDELANELMAAADASGERVWRMPLDDDFEPMLSSEVADVVNSASSRYGGAVFAAKFLEQFVGDGVDWAHLDIAGPARADSAYEEVPKGGTGVGVRTLLAWLSKS
jgi:leucyl aminopeptidase